MVNYKMAEIYSIYKLNNEEPLIVGSWKNGSPRRYPKTSALKFHSNGKSSEVTVIQLSGPKMTNGKFFNY
jgi:hypothetical protein